MFRTSCVKGMRLSESAGGMGLVKKPGVKQRPTTKLSPPNLKEGGGGVGTILRPETRIAESGGGSGIFPPDGNSCGGSILPSPLYS